MKDEDIAQLAVNTIRTLAIDAVQKANSGHPGLPMGAAPMAYVLVAAASAPQSPRIRTGPTVTASCLSAGHGSMLLYCLLHLTGYDLTLDDLQAFRQWESRTPGTSRDAADPGRRSDNRSARAGHGQCRRHGDGRACARASFQPSRSHDRRSPDVRDRLRRRPDGRHLGRGGVARGPSEARQADLPLRLQPHLARRADLAGVLDRGRRRALRGVRLAGPARRERRHRPRRDRSRARARPKPRRRGPRSSSCKRRSATASPKKQGTSEAHGSPARAGRGGGGQEDARLRSRAVVLRSRPRPGRTCGRRSSAARAQQAEWDGAFRALCEARIPELAAEWKRVQAGELPAGWDDGPAGVRREGRAGDAPGVGQGAECDRRARARAPRRRCRSVGIDQHLAQGRRLVRRADRRGAQHPFRRARARHGSDRQRDGLSRRRPRRSSRRSSVSRTTCVRPSAWRR